MGRFLNFFKKIGGGIKKAFNWVKEKIAPVVKPIFNIAKPLVGMIPGVGPAIQKGMMIGEQVANGADKFINGSAQDRKNLINQGIGAIGNRMGMPAGAGPKIM
jgi:phage-related protein